MENNSSSDMMEYFKKCVAGESSSFKRIDPDKINQDFDPSTFTIVMSERNFETLKKLIQQPMKFKKD